MVHIEIYHRKVFNMFAEKLISLHDNKYTYASILCTSKDIKPILPGMLVLKCIDNESILSFSLELAEKTKSFIEANKNVDTIYICCDSGESQSAAIASFIRRLLGEDEQIIWGNPYLRPNPLVYQLLCEKYDIIISKNELKRYVRQNKNAFKKAIWRGNRQIQLNRRWYEIGVNSKCDDNVKKKYFSAINNLTLKEVNAIKSGIMSEHVQKKVDLIFEVFSKSDMFNVLFGTNDNLFENNYLIEEKI